MDITQIYYYFAGAHILATWVLAAVVYLNNKGKVMTIQLDAIELELRENLGAHGTRLVRLETVQSNAPTHADIAQVYEKMALLAQSSSRMEGQLDTMDGTLRLILSRMTERSLS